MSPDAATTTTAPDLAAAIAAASDAASASAAVASSSDFIRRHPHTFFSAVFPSFLSRLFGFSSSSPSFLSFAASNSSLAAALLSFLGPGGDLLSAAFDADRCASIKYLFPQERLPRWLCSGRANPAIAAASPLVSVCENQVSVFEYYILWFAYYPVSGGDAGSSVTSFEATRSRIENWVSSIPGIPGSSLRKPSLKTEESAVYLKLLYEYLRTFVPNNGVGFSHPYRSSLLHHYIESDNSIAFLRAEFLMHALVQFWLVGNDFSPLPRQASYNSGSFCSATGFATDSIPCPGVADAVNLLLKYLNCMPVLPQNSSTPKMIDKRKPGAVVGYESLPGYWNAFIQRPLYRFILRSILLSPMGASIKNVEQVFSLWMIYMEPWNTSLEELAQYENPNEGLKVANGGNKKTGNQNVRAYTRACEHHVLVNYLFYSSLPIHFLGLAHKFLNNNVEAVTQMVAKLLDVLTSSDELLDLLLKIDAAYHTKPAVVKSLSSDDITKHIPIIRQQLQDWEDGLSESEADGSFLHEHWNYDLKLFSGGEDGAQYLLQLLLVRIESEVQRLQSDATKILQSVDLIKSRMSKLFVDHCKFPCVVEARQERSDQQSGHGELFAPKHPRKGKGRLADRNYRGDWMRRPISDAEIAWLARILIWFSDWLNAVLGLNGIDEGNFSSRSSAPTYVEVDTRAVRSVGVKEALYAVSGHIYSWFVLLGQMLLRFMRVRRMKINLRILASKKLLFAVFLYAAAALLKFAWSSSFGHLRVRG